MNLDIEWILKSFILVLLGVVFPISYREVFAIGGELLVFLGYGGLAK